MRHFKRLATINKYTELKPSNIKVFETLHFQPTECLFSRWKILSVC